VSRIAVLDSTLRDGAQGEGISFSVTDKLNIVRALDDLGVDLIEAGNPGSNPKDLDF
jgi:2-isopropylmalate synthase